MKKPLPIIPQDERFILKAGPIIFDPSGPPFYKPTNECNCVEGANRLCVSCKNYLSEKLSIRKIVYK
mgnify:CR=1 FL=1